MSRTSSRKSGRFAGLEMPAPQINKTSPRACDSISLSGIAAKPEPREMIRSSADTSVIKIYPCPCDQKLNVQARRTHVDLCSFEAIWSPLCTASPAAYSQYQGHATTMTKSEMPIPVLQKM